MLSTWEEFIAKKTGAEGKSGDALLKHLSTVKNNVGETLNVQG